MTEKISCLRITFELVFNNGFAHLLNFFTMIGVARKHNSRIRQQTAVFPQTREHTEQGYAGQVQCSRKAKK